MFIPYKEQMIIVAKLKEFAQETGGMLSESVFDFDYCSILHIGGGATIRGKFLEQKDNVTYLEDIKLNAKGYELLAAHQMNR